MSFRAYSMPLSRSPVSQPAAASGFHFRCAVARGAGYGGQTVRDAVAFSAEIVSRKPTLCCEIYDHEGKSGALRRIVYDPALRRKYEGLEYSKRQALWGALALLVGVGFVVHGFRQNLTWIWGYVIGLKLMTVGEFRMSAGLIGWMSSAPNRT